MGRSSITGGVYSYTKEAFGRDHAFLSCWFLCLSYLTIVFLNGTALFIIVRTLLSDVSQTGMHCEVAGNTIYLSETIVSVLALAGVGALFVWAKPILQRLHTVLSVLLLAGILVIAAFCLPAAIRSGSAGDFGIRGLNRPYAVFSMVIMAPWAFVGFEVTAFDTAHFRFPMRKSRRITFAAIVLAALAYISMTPASVASVPDGFSSWQEYISALDGLNGIASAPTFYAAKTVMGPLGLTVMAVTAVAAILTGIIGGYRATTRVLSTMAEDHILSERFSKTTYSILFIMALSILLSLLGRNTLNWFVDLTSFGAIVGFGYTSAAAWKIARAEGNRRIAVTGMAGTVISAAFAVVQLVPRLAAMEAMGSEAYLLLSLWCLLGFVFYWRTVTRSSLAEYSGMSASGVVLFTLLIYSAMMWLAKRVVAGESTEQMRSSLIRGGILMLAVVLLGLAVMLYVQNVVREKHEAAEREKIHAVESSLAKSQFLFNMSHDIRTPMNAIIGLDSLALRKDGLDGETREYLEKIGESARHLLGLINDILDMSRIESGRMILRKEEFSFRTMLEQINTMVMSRCNEKGLKYECSVIGGVSDCYIGDDMKLKQVLINILSNAIKFTDAPGSIKLTVERTAAYEGQSTLRFAVQDTGIGIDPSFIPKIFDSFTQEDSSRNNKYGSTGLGMAITKNIVELMNGTISVTSQKGVGTEFTVIVTLRNSSQQGRGPGLVKPKDMRVLVVDDEEIAAEHARIVLDEAGIASDTCFSGPEALHMLEVAYTKHMPYNLVLLDWKMPDMDGIEVAAEIRRRYDRETTVIILTSFNWDEIMDEALHVGVDSFLAKPLFASNVMDEFERIARKNNLGLFSPEKHRATLSGRHILLAEDILTNAQIMRKLLSSKEAIVDHAENGRIVLDMLRDSSPGFYDAILMDVRMPEMDGLEATAAIRALDRPDAKIIPIIALTANAFDEDVQLSLQAGMNAHLSKPVEPEHLYQTLEELIWEAEQ